MSAAAPARIKNADSGPVIKKRDAGYLQIDFRAEFYELPRLTSGKVEICILMYILSETKSAALIEVRSKGKSSLRMRAKGEGAPRFTRHITIAEFAEFANAKPRAVEDALSRMSEAGVIEKDRKGPGYRCCVEAWEKLPNYTPEPIALTAVPEPEPDEEEEEDEQISAEAVQVFETPLLLLPGRAGRARALPKPAVKVQLRSDIKAHVDAVIAQGLLFIRIHGMAPESAKSGEEKAINHATTRTKGTSAASKSLEVNGFGKFMEAAILCELPASEVDWKRARITWSQLSANEQLQAVAGLRAARDAGDFEDARFRPRPDKYLGEKAWQRGVRGKAKKHETAEDRTQGLLRRAAELGLGGRK